MGSRPRLRWLCAGFMLGASLAFTGTLSTESMTLTTYYPSPYGVYDQLRSVGDSFFAYQRGRVGIGTKMPTSLLSVAGSADMESLHVAGGASVGSLRIKEGAAEGRILESDAQGNVRWSAPRSSLSCTTVKTVADKKTRKRPFRAVCPSGTMATGGGFRIGGERVRDSYLDGNGWVCALSESTPGAICFAICCQVAQQTHPTLLPKAL